MNTMEEFRQKVYTMLTSLQQHNPRVELTSTWHTYKGHIFIRISRVEPKSAWYFIRLSDGEIFGAKDWTTPNLDVNFWNLNTYLSEVMHRQPQP